MNYRLLTVGLFALFLFASSVNCQSEEEEEYEEETRSQRWMRRFSQAKGWLDNKVYSPLASWVKARWAEREPSLTESWNESKAMLNEQYERVLTKIDDTFGEGTVEGMRTRYRETYQKGLELNRKLKEYFQNDFSWQKLVDDPREQLAKIEEILKSVNKINLKELAAAEEEQRKEDGLDVNTKPLAQEIEEKLITLRGDLEKSRKIRIEEIY